MAALTGEGDYEYDYDLEGWVKNTRSGYRRSDPTSQPTGVSPPPPPATGGGRVAGAGPAAAGDRSMECDICHIQEKSHWHLRNHYKAVHRKPNGSMYNCRLCQFGALNQVHLKKHFDTQHPDLSCENCDFKTKRESQLKYHVGQECPKAVKIEKKDVTCRYFGVSPPYLDENNLGGFKLRVNTTYRKKK